MNDVLLRYYTQRMQNVQRIRGTVLNVGLGDGAAAVFFLDKRAVTSITSVENNPVTITKFTALYGADPLHLIVEGDAAKVDALVTGPFDLIYVDIIMDFTEPVYATLRAMCEAIIRGKLLAAGGALMIEYQGDVPVEREFRNQWMPSKFREIREKMPMGLQTHPISAILYESKSQGT